MSTTAVPQSADRPVPALVYQFLSITGVDGYPFTFRYWNNELGGFIGDDPTLCTHYQGMNRVMGADGTSYLYLTRNGNAKNICSGSSTDYPGEILIVEMGDRNRSGHAFEVNPAGWPLEMRQPLVEDHSVKSITLNGVDPIWNGEDVDWKHPGSGQAVGDRLFIPVEKTCNYDSGAGQCVGDEEDRGAILVFNLADPQDPGVTPANPRFLCQIERVQITSGDLLSFEDLPKMGNLAVTVKDGTYLFAHTTGGSYHKETALTFYELGETDLCSEQNPDQSPVVAWLSHWNADHLQDINGATIGEDEWRKEGTWWGAAKKLDWQMINFVRDLNGDLYLITTDKSWALSAVHDDWAKLFRVLRSGDAFAVQFVAQKHFYLDEPTDIGSFEAVGAVYVTPEGRLILYSGAHDNDWPKFIFTENDPMVECGGDDRCRSLELGEFAANYFHPPVLTLPEEVEVDEGTLTSFPGCSFTDLLTAGQSWQVEVAWGDALWDAMAAVPGAPLPMEHLYVEGPVVHTVTVTVTDSDGFSGSGSVQVTVDNLPPTVSIDAVSDEGGGILGVDIPFTFPGRELALSGSYTDPGAEDTHTGIVAWGDGALSEFGALNGSIRAPHAYEAPGAYTATLTVIDDDGGAGEATVTVPVSSLVDGLWEVVALLRPDAGNYRVGRAIADLEGQNAGRASNGAIDLLEKGNTNAALVHLGHAVRELAAARVQDPELDLEVPLALLAMAREALAE